MATLEISEGLAERLREMAQKEAISVEEIIRRMMNTYMRRSTRRTSYMMKLYAEARRYWYKEGDTERLALTDKQLDEQFWCIDPDGIPRLKSDQEKITLPPDGLPEFLESVWQDNPTGEVDEDIDYREILSRDFPDYLWRRMQGIDERSSADR